MKIIIGNKSFEVSKEALESNPNEIKLDFDGTIRTTEEDSVFVENQKKEARKEGIEISVKQFREKYGFEGRTIEKLIEAVEKKTLEEAKIEPTEQIKKLQKTLDEKETALQNALEQVNKKENEFKTFVNQNKIDSLVNSLIPENTILPKEDIKLILKNKLKFDTDENGSVLVLGEDGSPLKDKTTANPRNAKDVIDDFFKDNQSYLKSYSGGSGAGDSSNSGSKKSIDDFIKEQQDKGVKPNSTEFNETLKTQMEAGLIEVD